MVSLVITSVFSLNPIGASAAWKKDFNGWWNTEGNSWSVGWRQINSKWYYFGQDGYMRTGWIKDGGKWYYLNEDGSMAYDVTINGYKLGSNGDWIQSTENSAKALTEDKNLITNNIFINKLIKNLKIKFDNVNIKNHKAKSDFLSAQNGEKIDIGDEKIYLYIYKTDKEMEEDSSNVPSDGCQGKDVVIDYDCSIHYYKTGNIIAFYPGDDKTIISILEDTLGNQFAGDK